MGKYIRYLLVLLLVADIAYSFVQHSQIRLDGDMASVILPPPELGEYKVLQDPFGLSALLKNEVYNGPNRFFAHWTTSTYYKTIPLLIQNFTNPITSVYLASAILKTIVQVLLIYLLASYISGTRDPRATSFLVAALLVTPLFQTYGYNRYMGVIDQSATYTFFYALPIGLTLLFFLPFFRWYENPKANKISWGAAVLLALLAIVLAFNGPLIPGILGVVCSTTFIALFWNRYKKIQGTFISRVLGALREIPIPLIILFLFIGALCAYSLYIGTFNAANLYKTLPLEERFARLPSGIRIYITKKLGVLILLVAIIINFILVKKKLDPGIQARLMALLKWAAIFVGLYILLLPFGGSRLYRPNILRYDTLIPVTLTLFFLYGRTALVLLRNLDKTIRPYYLAGTIILICIYTNADRIKWGQNECEKESLALLAESAEPVVFINNRCNIMSWKVITNPEDSKMNSRLLHLWNITDKPKLYFHPEE